ncbi:MAG: hypothetical protein HY784_02685 [Chloroflexi bacterium]|nr:hypothetical protein [Chloroflexota bacterium]
MRNFLRRFKADLLIALGLLLLPLLLFWPVALGDHTLLPADNLLAVEPWKSAAPQFGVGVPAVPHNKLLDDLVLENYPWKEFILESLHAGQIPLWNPYLFAGLPFLAAGQHSALYPFSIIFYLFPLPRAYGVFTVSQFFLAGLFAYIFLRVLGLRRVGAAFGAIVYELSLFMVVSVVFSMIVAGAVWLPLILASIELIARQQPALGGRPATMPWLALGAAALGLQILAGHVEITYYTLLVSGAYSLWKLAGLWRGREREKEKARGNQRPGRSAKMLVRRGGALLALAGLGVGLGAIQLIPLFELVRHNFRSGSATFEQIIGWAYPWRHALLFLIPNFYGNPRHHAYFDLFTHQWTPATVNALGQAINTIDWGIKNYVEGGAYLGLLPMLLIPIVGIVWLRSIRSHQPLLGFGHWDLGFFFCLTFFSLSFAFPTRLYALIFWLPGINQLHSPFRWVWPLSLSAAYRVDPVAIGHDLHPNYLSTKWALSQKSEVRSQKPEVRNQPLWFLRLFCLWSRPSLITFFAGVAVWGGTFTLVGLIAARVWYDRLAGLMDRLVNDLAKADEAFADGRMFFSYEARWAFIFALMLIASGIVLRVSRCPIYWRGRPVWEYFALGVITLDLLVAGWGFNPAADPAILSYVPPSVEFLRQDTGLWRFTTYDTSKCRPTANGDTEPCKPFNAATTPSSRCSTGSTWS